jgi:hypothetical protein
MGYLHYWCNNQLSNKIIRFYIITKAGLLIQPLLIQPIKTLIMKLDYNHNIKITRLAIFYYDFRHQYS